MQRDSYPPRIWGLLGHRTGDNNQLLGLCERLGVPFETRSLNYNALRHLEGLHPPTFASLTRESRRWLAPPWPDLLITIGRRSLPIAREIKLRSGGHTALVLIGHPRTDPGAFDLIITTNQYPLPNHRNVLVLPMVISRLRGPPRPTIEEQAWLEQLPRPHLLLALGGSTKYFDLAPELMIDAAKRLADRAESRGGTLIVSGSPRTERSVVDAVRQAVPAHPLVEDAHPRFALLMSDADEVFVTGDSLSMLSEAVLTGRPVGMVEPALNATGRRWLGEGSSQGLGRGRRRDLRRMWHHLKSEGLVGTVDQPVAGAPTDPARVAAEAVRRLLT